MILELSTTKYSSISIQSQHIVAIAGDSDEHGFKICKIYALNAAKFELCRIFLHKIR